MSSISSSSSTTPSGSKGFMNMPAELYDQVDAHLSYEDSNNFKSAHPLIDTRLTSNLIHYDKLHVSDDEDECWISDTRGRVTPRKFRANNAPDLIGVLESLKEITVIMKDVNIKDIQAHGNKKNLTDYTPYTPDGYLKKLFGNISPAQLKLRQLSLHVDIMVETLDDVFCLACPTQDLNYSMDQLANSSFSSFIQISICCAQIRQTDERARNHLLHGMQMALKEHNEKGAKTEFVIEPCEGYVDMTIEKGNVEYSFAFFYYNPTICDPTPEETEMMETNVDEPMA